jgi:transcriptional regulator with XRE-family HTH domain
MSTDKTAASTELSVDPSDRMRDRIRARLSQRNISAREVSRRAGFNVGYVGDLLEGRSKNPDLNRILRLADALEVPVGHLTGEIDIDATPYATEPEVVAALQVGATVPLYAARIAMNNPWVPVEWKPLENVQTLPNLRTTEGAYAVAVFNDLNAPRYFLGETIYVSPVAPIRVGDFILACDQDGRCSIGRLASVDSDSATWTLLANNETVTASLADLKSFHKVVGSVA